MTNRPDQPIIQPDKPWETGNMLISITALPDPTADRLRLYYFIRVKDNPTKNLLCVAYSTDGYHWTKPNLGDGTNIVMKASGNETGWGQFMPTSILFDPTDSDASQHWKMIYWDRLTPNVPFWHLFGHQPRRIHVDAHAQPTRHSQCQRRHVPNQCAQHNERPRAWRSLSHLPTNLEIQPHLAHRTRQPQTHTSPHLCLVQPHICLPRHRRRLGRPHHHFRKRRPRPTRHSILLAHPLSHPLWLWRLSQLSSHH